MNLYKKYFLPKLLNFTMRKDAFRQYRPSVVKDASGIVLEIGFGSGLNMPYYENVTRLYALEPSEELYHLAKERIAHASFPVEFLKASAEDIPLRDGSVDTIVSTWTMCSIPHPDIALREISRVLKPEGKFIFIEHGKSSNNFVAKLQKIFSPISECCAGGCHLDRDIEKFITDAQFEITKLEKFQKGARFLVFMYKGKALPKNMLK